MIATEFVELRGGFSEQCRVLRVPAFRLGEWAAHRQIGMPSLWGLSLLPLGLCLGQDWASFRCAGHAIAAMKEIVRIRNDWSIITQADLTLGLEKRLRAITRRHGAVANAPVGIVADADSPLMPVAVNGYQRR